MATASLLRKLLVLLTFLWPSEVRGVTLKSDEVSPWTNEFETVELSCVIESISSRSPRIEWKKIKDGNPSYVFFHGRISGDLENRARLREPASLVIENASRTDSAQYRCEVTAPEDQRSFAELLINLVVRVRPVMPKCAVPAAVPVGKPAEFRCSEEEGFPRPKFQWFRNSEEIPIDPKTSPRFQNASYSMDTETGMLSFGAVRKEDEGVYFCRAKNEAGFSECRPQKMEVYDLNVAGIVLGVVVVVTVLALVTAGICCAYRRGYLSQQKQDNFKAPAKGDGVDYVRTEEEGDFRHKSSFII
ncbi:junctional adhesion molecule 3B [Clupea harengus]|uniref:Junctional adhesion molecule 3B n=1 Tax=Clupea harengus TaxID=7950 RepID=A0A6P8FVJ5_CLUHA|nr:junctional adhesion molecule 3B [Clupea harengus]